MCYYLEQRVYLPVIAGPHGSLSVVVITDEHMGVLGELFCAPGPRRRRLQFVLHPFPVVEASDVRRSAKRVVRHISADNRRTLSLSHADKRKKEKKRKDEGMVSLVKLGIAFPGFNTKILLPTQKLTSRERRANKSQDG